MDTITTDQGPVDLATVTKVEFVPGGSFPGTKKAVLDGTASATALTEINKVRAAIGAGDGTTTGWVQVTTTSNGVANNDAYVQLARVDAVVRPTVVLLRGSVVLGVPAAAALPAIDAKFPPG